MLILLLIMLLIVTYGVTAWVIIAKYHMYLFMCEPEELSGFGKCLRWYVMPIVLLITK